MTKLKRNRHHNLSRGRRFAFILISVIFPFGLLALLEGALRCANYGKDYSLFIPYPVKGYDAYYAMNPETGAKYFKQFEYSLPPNDLFLKEKEKGSLRVVVMGSSSVVGFPYEANLSFPRILQYRLQQAFPGRRIEVISTALTAVNSYTLRDMTGSILKIKPDMILIYAGHNEFYGAFGIGSNEGIGRYPGIIRIHLQLMHLRLYQLMRNAITHIQKSENVQTALQKRGTLMTKIVRKADIQYGSKDYIMGIKQFQRNMSHILKVTENAGIPVFISTLVSNLRDQKPFGSIRGEGSQRADSLFSQAQNCELAGNFSQALTLFKTARDHDCVRFRASGDINNTIVELANKYHAHLVDAEKVFSDSSAHGLLGNNLMTEHVHPNAEGYFLLADVFYRSLMSSGLAGKPEFSELIPSAGYIRQVYGYTMFDSLLGYHRIKNLSFHWPFVDESLSFKDYRILYQPDGMLDSLTFNLMAGKIGNPYETRLKLAERYAGLSDMNRAYMEYKALVQMDPYNPLVLREAGNFFIRFNDLPLANICFKQSLQFEDSYFALFRLGEICMIMNDFSQAAQDFSKAYAIAPPNYKPKILVKLYPAYVYLGKSEEARQVLNALRQFQPGYKSKIPEPVFSLPDYIPLNIQHEVEMARQAMIQNNFSQAVAWLNKALSKNDSPVANRFLGECYLRLMDTEKAWKCMQKAYLYNRFDPVFLSEMIPVEVAHQRTDLAKTCLDQLKLINPSDPRIGIFEQMLR